MSFEFPVLKVVKVIDGNSVCLVIDLGFGIRRIVDVRLIGVDAPEIHGEHKAEGLCVRSAIQGWLEGYSGYNSSVLVLKSEKLDKEHDVLGDVQPMLFTHMSPRTNTIPHESLCGYLLSMSYARRYQGGERRPWTDEDLEWIRRCIKTNEEWDKKRKKQREEI